MQTKQQKLIYSILPTQQEQQIKSIQSSLSKFQKFRTNYSISKFIYQLIKILILFLILQRSNSAAFGTCQCQGFNFTKADNTTIVNTCSSCSVGCYSNYTGNCTYSNTSICYSMYDCYQYCLPYCLACDTTTTCAQCHTSIGYFLNSTKNCQQCSTKWDSNCQSCNSSQCTNCRIFYYLDSNNSCIYCGLTYPNCSFCNSTQCYYCNSGYYLNSSSICSPCADHDTSCLYCNSTNCTSCISPYIFNSLHICAFCNQTFGQACLTCTSSGCYNCSLPYFVNSSSICSLCNITFDPHCQTCSVISCLNCQIPYVLSINNTCFLCNQTYGIQCMTCDSSSCITCDTIFLPYFVNSSGICSLCSLTYGSPCLTCDQIQCLSCMNPYVRNMSSPKRFCVSCNLYKASSCIDGPKCNKCVDGFYCDNTSLKCLPCSYPCLTCNTTANQCLSCEISQQLYFYDNSSKICSLCSDAIPECYKCNSQGTICYMCISNLTFITSNDSTCSYCIPPCLECLNETACLSCINSTYFYIQTLMKCQTCSDLMPNCIDCLTTDVCLACDNSSGTIYFLKFPQNGCIQCSVAHSKCLSCNQTAGVGPSCIVCQSKYYPNPITHGCSPCPDQCSECISDSVCTQCISIQYALISQKCLLCSAYIINCLECDNSSGIFCTKCVNSTVKSSNGNGSCMSCLITQFADPIAQQCYFCEYPCLQCSSLYECSSCVPFYQFSPLQKKCNDICGDKMVFQFQCDNGINILNDGCDDKCQPQIDWTCTINIGTLNGISANLSTCSYDKNVSIDLISIEKQPFENILTWTHSIKPFLFGLPGTISRAFTFYQLKKIFVFYDIQYGPVYSSYIPVGLGLNSSITILQIIVDAIGSTVTIKFSYETQIKYSNFQMMLNISYLKFDLNLSYFATTPNADHLICVSSYLNNSLIGRYYTEQQYSYAHNMYKAGLIISILTLIAFIIGIFTKEIAGLQMTMLCQFTYISLFFYNGTLQLPFYALKSLIYSTGYNIAWGQKFYQTLQKNPPQSLSLQFDTMTLFNNFNFMSLTYILPFIVVVPFIFLKAKCIRKLSSIQIGNKWVDLLIGQIMLTIVLFNYQYFLLNVITYFKDGRNIQNYQSLMIILIGIIFSFFSFLGLIFKPQIYENFRSNFKFNAELTSKYIEQQNQKQPCLDDISLKFKNQKKCQTTKKIFEKLLIIVNENYFWSKHRSFYNVLTYNHYVLLILYFSLTSILYNFLQNSQIVIIALSVLILVQLIIIRPYGGVDQKLRGIYFFFIYSFISYARYMNNKVLNGQYNTFLPTLALLFLFIALIWTYIRLISYFIRLITLQVSDEKKIVEKVFENEIQNELDKQKYMEQQAVLIRKLMKRYERVQLQYNVNDSRNQLLSKYLRNNDQNRQNINILNDSPKRLINNDLSIDNQQIKGQNDLILQRNSQQELQIKKIDAQISKKIQKASQTKNYRNIKTELQQEVKKKKKVLQKKKVNGQKLQKILQLDNYHKYQNYFLLDKSDPKKNQQPLENQSNFQLKQINYLSDQLQKIQNRKFQSQSKIQNIQQTQAEVEKDHYQSTEPKNIQQAEAKLLQENILMKQQQHLRYKRALKVLTKDGITVNEDLIENYFQKI